MAPLEAIFFWMTVCLYGTISAVYIHAFIFKKEKVLDRIYYFIGLAFLFHTLAILSRYRAVGNLPVAGNYENGLGGTWIVILFTLYICIRHKALRAVGIATLPFSVLMMGYGLMSGAELAPMTAAVRSFWLYIHVLFAWLAYASFTIAFGIAVIYLLKEKNEENAFYSRFPSLVRLDDRMFRYIVFGFITDAVMIASGAIWAKNLWGNYWNWDPIEMWSLLSWLIYGIAIHLRITLGWRGKRLAWITVFALITVFITFFGIDVVVKSSLHMFEAWQDM